LRQAHICKSWCIISDFNAIRSFNERECINNYERQKREFGGFNDFIDKNILLDVPLVGIKFTWYRSNGKVNSRLDKELVTHEWIDLWSASKQYILTR